MTSVTADAAALLAQADADPTRIEPRRMIDGLRAMLAYVAELEAEVASGIRVEYVSADAEDRERKQRKRAERNQARYMKAEQERDAARERQDYWRQRCAEIEERDAARDRRVAAEALRAAGEAYEGEDEGEDGVAWGPFANQWLRARADEIEKG